MDPAGAHAGGAADRDRPPSGRRTDLDAGEQKAAVRITTIPPLVIVVLGRPASGKTTVARRLAERFGLPLLAKDAFKELLFDRLGSGDRAWSVALGRAAFDVLDHAVEQQLLARVPFIVEAPYDARYESERFAARQRRFGFRALQVHCVASDEVLVQRFESRARSGQRHAGHGDAADVDAFRRSLQDVRCGTLALDGPVIELDVTDEAAAARLLEQTAAVLRSTQDGLIPQ